MSGLISAGVAAVSIGASMYMADQANSAADARADAANATSSAAADKSKELAKIDADARKEELLRRFGITSTRLQDTSTDILRATSMKLTSFEMELAKAQSVSDNNLATNHITGRLADRMRSTISIQGTMQEGTILQDAEAQIKDVGSKLETMTMNYESDQLDLGIDLANSINAATNQQVASYAYSQAGSSGTAIAGAVSTGLSTGMSAYSIMR